MHIGASISYFVKKGGLSSILFNQILISFDLQIGATEILVSPKFECQS